MNYLLTFYGHIDERKRPENFPRKISAMLLVTADNDGQIVDQVNKETLQYIRQQGMSVRMDPDAMEDLSKLDTNRMFVPMHMITHLTAEVKPIQNDIIISEEGGLVTAPSGKKVEKN